MNLACPLRLKKGHEVAVKAGMPWIYAGDIIESSQLLLIPPGSLVAIENYKGQALGTGYYNTKSQIACRVLTPDKESIDLEFFQRRLQKALALREKLFKEPYYRFAHSESDGLPGLLLDRFGDIVVAQVGTAGMELLQPLWLEALERLIEPEAVLLRNDISARGLEGLKQDVKLVKGNVPAIVELQENDCIYLADLWKGQKTGWFYDQRLNRKMIADIAKGKTLIDVYSHSGGFGLLAAKAGAKVTLLDSSQPALELARAAAARNAVQCDYFHYDAFAGMEALINANQKFGIVLADPPAFVKAKKDIAAGLKGYEKVARLAASLVAPGGHLFVASCSHHASRGAFNNAVLEGIKKASRAGTILKQTGAGPDHPVHPKLPQSEYLKGILLALD